MTLVRLHTRRITDWPTFHDVFAELFGFPEFYGRNMDAWIDCMTSLDSPEDAMTTVHAAPGGVVTLHLEEAHDFALRCPDQYAALVECAGFVNWRRIEAGEPAILAVSFCKDA
jgi:RNAse (barnase) inhibitor barstar